MATSMVERIGERIDAMPSGERRAAHALMADYPMAGLRTVAEFSGRAGVSGPTILRFVSRLGFQGYAEFQAALKEELAARLQSPMLRSVTSPAAGAHPAVDATLDNIRETFSHISDRQIADIGGLLADPRHALHLLGGRFTDPVARYMAAHLTIVRPKVFHLAGQESNWRDRLLDIARHDVLIVLDIRRYQESLLNFAEKARARGARIVLITDQWLSPIARVATQVIACRTAVPSPWDSSASLFVVVETLVGEATRRAGDAGARRIRDLEDLR
ncbi:MAG: MurR/RpiR family transcriptional regulator [Rhizobiaceae bacterium]